MGQLKQRPDGGYYTQLGGRATGKSFVVTYQITHEGVKYLADKGVRRDGLPVNPHLSYLERQGWAYTGGSGVTTSSVSSDIERREYESDPRDRPPLRGVPRLSILPNVFGEFAISVVVPRVPADRWNALSLSVQRQFETKTDLRFYVKDLTRQTFSASSVIKRSQSLPITPHFNQHIAISTTGAWPAELQWPELTVPLDGLTDYELFALPEFGGFRLRRPPLAPGDSVHFLQRPSGNNLWSTRLAMIGCPAESKQTIGEWTLYYLKLPSVSDDQYEKALNIINAKPAQASWRLRVMSPSVLEIDAANRPTFQLQGKLYVEATPTLHGHPSGKSFDCAMTLFRDEGDERDVREYRVELLNETPQHFDLPLALVGAYTVVVGNEELGWTRRTFSLARDTDNIAMSHRHLAVVFKCDRLNRRIDGLQTSGSTIALGADQIDSATVSILQRRPDRSISLSLFPPAPGSGQTLSRDDEQPSSTFLHALRSLLHAKETVLLTISDGAVSTITLTLRVNRAPIALSTPSSASTTQLPPAHPPAWRAFFDAGIARKRHAHTRGLRNR